MQKDKKVKLMWYMINYFFISIGLCNANYIFLS